MEEKKQYSALTIDRAAFLLLRVKKAFKKKKLQRSKEREKNAQLATTSRVDQRASCVGIEGTSRSSKKPPPLLRSRTLPAIVVPGVNIIQAQLGNCPPPESTSPLPSCSGRSPISSKFHPSRISFSKDDTGLECRRKSAVSRLCTTSNFGPERGSDGTLILRVPAPHVVAARAYRISNPSSSGSSGSNSSLFKIGKLLNQSSSKSQIVVDDSNVVRRLSWERRGTLSNRMPRSASIDSMVEAVWAENVEPAEPTMPEKRPSLRPDRTIALVSPSVGRRMKGQRGINGEWCIEEV